MIQPRWILDCLNLGPALQYFLFSFTTTVSMRDELLIFRILRFHPSRDGRIGFNVYGRDDVDHFVDWRTQRDNVRKDHPNGGLSFFTLYGSEEN